MLSMNNIINKDTPSGSVVSGQILHHDTSEIEDVIQDLLLENSKITSDATPELISYLESLGVTEQEREELKVPAPQLSIYIS